MDYNISLPKIEKTTLEQKSAAIACRRFPGSHTFDRIATEVENIHDEFGLNAEKVIASVTDNASNFVKAFREFGVEYSEIGKYSMGKPGKTM